MYTSASPLSIRAVLLYLLVGAATTVTGLGEGFKPATDAHSYATTSSSHPFNPAGAQTSFTPNVGVSNLGLAAISTLITTTSTASPSSPISLNPRQPKKKPKKLPENEIAYGFGGPYDALQPVGPIKRDLSRSYVPSPSSSRDLISRQPKKPKKVPEGDRHVEEMYSGNIGKRNLEGAPAEDFFVSENNKSSAHDVSQLDRREETKEPKIHNDGDFSHIWSIFLGKWGKERRQLDQDKSVSVGSPVPTSIRSLENRRPKKHSHHHDQVTQPADTTNIL